MEKNQKKYLGFTLFEVLITVIIVGGLASLAIPQYRMIREQFIANEGKSILITLVGSLKRFSTDVGGTLQNTAASFSQLDVSYPFNADVGKNFANIQVIGGNHGFTIRRRIDGQDIYLLCTDEMGNISCGEQNIAMGSCSCTSCFTVSKGLSGICAKILRTGH